MARNNAATSAKRTMPSKLIEYKEKFVHQAGVIFRDYHEMQSRASGRMPPNDDGKPKMVAPGWLQDSNIRSISYQYGL